MKKRLGFLICLIILFTSVFSGCGAKTSSGGGKVRIFLSMYNQGKPGSFRQSLIEAAQNKAASEGLTLEVAYAQDSIETQVEHIKKAVAEKYDVILCGPVSADTAVELEANAGDVPIIFICNCPEDKRLKADRYVYVGSDENVAGQFQAEYVLDRFAAKQEINVMIIKGPKGQSATAGRTKGAKRALEDSGKKINYVFEDYADWDKAIAKEMFTIFQRTGNPVDCVLCNNDTMAMGIVEYCKENGIDPGKLPILGVNAAADACDAILKGEMALTVYQSGKGQGEAAIEAAVRLAGGESVKGMNGVTDDLKYVWVPFERVDARNAAQYK